MNNTSTPIDISNIPALVRIVEEMKHTKQPRLLKQDSEPVAMLMPVGKTIQPEKMREKTKADYEAFRSAAGSWKEVDTDTLLKNIYEDRRRINNRPPVKL